MLKVCEDKQEAFLLAFQMPACASPFNSQGWAGVTL